MGGAALGQLAPGAVPRAGVARGPAARRGLGRTASVGCQGRSVVARKGAHGVSVEAARRRFAVQPRRTRRGPLLLKG